MMVFYAFRGIAMLLGQMLRRKPKPVARPAAPAPSPVATSEPVAAPSVAQADASAEVAAAQVSAADVYGVDEAPAGQSSQTAAKPVVVEARSTAAQKKAGQDAQPAEGESDEVNGAPPVQAGRGKGAGRRGIRLKLIQPGEGDTGLK
jgi:hypothetical protein